MALTKQTNVVSNKSRGLVFFESQELCYNYKTDQWTDIPAYDGIGMYSIYDPAGIVGLNRFSGAAVDLQTQTNAGVAQTAIFETAETDPNTGGRAIVNGIRPLTNGGTLRVRAGVKDSLSPTARTNLLLNSEDFSVTWTNTFTTDVQNVGTAPNGDNTANSLNEDGSAGVAHYIGQVFTGADDTTYTFSIYLKASNRTWARVSFLPRVGGATLGAYFDLGNGVAGTVDASVTAVMTAAEDSFYRCSVTADIGSGGTSEACRFNIAEADTDGIFDGLTQESILCWGAMCELGSTPGSYIKTTTVTASDTINWSEFTAPNSRTEMADTRSEGKFHRAEVTIAGGFTTAMGADIEFSPAGKV